MKVNDALEDTKPFTLTCKLLYVVGIDVKIAVVPEVGVAVAIEKKAPGEYSWLPASKLSYLIRLVKLEPVLTLVTAIDLPTL